MTVGELIMPDADKRRAYELARTRVINATLAKIKNMDDVLVHAELVSARNAMARAETAALT